MTKSFGGVIGGEIKYRRDQKGWTQENLAEAAGVDVARIGKWERGEVSNPRGRLLQKVCDKLGITREEVDRLRSQAWRNSESKKGQTEHYQIRNNCAASANQPTLSPAPVSQLLSHYATRTLDVLGREQEQLQLRMFLDESEAFSWMQIAGVGGQGKSRLAYELMLETQCENWIAGFLTDDDLAAFAEHWATWQPNSPHLLILDYVVGREEQIGPMFRQLARRSGELRMPVRMLFLERQRWDCSNIRSERDEKESLHQSSYFNDRADWFVKLTERYDGNDASLDKTRFKEDNGVVELKRLSKSALVTIVRGIAGEQGTKLEMSDQAIYKQLEDIDRAGRPLYACFLGEMLGSNITRQYWTRGDLLDEVLRKDWAQRWQSVFDGAIPMIGEDHPAARLATLATMIGGLDCKLLGLRNPTISTAMSVRRQAQMLTGGAISAGTVKQFIPSLQPDILGEWLVLRMLEGDLPIGQLCEAAWNISSKNFSHFLSRISYDFTFHPSTINLISCDSPSEFSIQRSFALLKLYLNYSNSSDDKEHRSQSIKLLYEAADFGNDIAMSLYLLADSKARREGESFLINKAKISEWCQKAINLENPISTCILGEYYLFGVGVEQDEKQAFEMFLKSAELGNDGGMIHLSDSYDLGRGVDNNHAAAFDWCLKSAQAGNPRGMLKLSLFYSSGEVVEKDMSLAVDWCRKAVDEGEPEAMMQLTRYYVGNPELELEPDAVAATELWEMAADAGSPDAMLLMAICYFEGVDVEKNRHRAVELCQKAASLGGKIHAQTLATDYDFELK